MSKKQVELFPDAVIGYGKALRPERTAMRRRTASPIARGLVTSGFLRQRGVGRILDYGCGVGRDVEYYRANGFEAVGFDPHPSFGFASEPIGTFDVVVCLFVLNVLAEPASRSCVCRRLIGLAGATGLIVVAARSPRAIAAEAQRKDWVPFKDGFLSSPGRGTFQKGLSREEIMSFFDKDGIAEVLLPIKRMAEVSVCGMERRWNGDRPDGEVNR